MNTLRRVAPRPGLVCKENPYRLGSLASSLDVGAAAKEPGLPGGIFIRVGHLEAPNPIVPPPLPPAPPYRAGAVAAETSG